MLRALRVWLVLRVTALRVLQHSYGGVIPACSKMLATVLGDRSFFGWGTVTVPFFVSCWKWWCEPLVRFNSQPSALRILMISREERLLPMRELYNRSVVFVNNCLVVSCRFS